MTDSSTVNVSRETSAVQRLEREGDVAADYLEGLLDIADLDAHYGSRQVLHAVNMQVNRGEIMGLMFLGLALTEAITFYALLMGFVAFFLV